jgi:DNA-binding response OmpR family regulator
MSQDLATLSGSVFRRILVVDDDASILRLLRDILEREGYEVLQASSGAEALATIGRVGLPHLAIVDLLMPGMSGFEFAQHVQAYVDLPIIMLTAVTEEQTVVQGIQRYAEDYITKPFRPRELVARVDRVLRRMGDYVYALAPVMRIDERMEADFTHQQVRLDGEPISLTPTETKILYILLRNAGRVVSTDFLLRRIWPLEDAYAEALRVHVHRLRQKLGVSTGGHPYILTERGLGYRFQAIGS